MIAHVQEAFSVTRKAVTRPVVDEDSLVICADILFVSKNDKVEFLLDLKIFLAISGVKS